MMKILAINGFHDDKEQALHTILNSFLKGAEEKGAEIKKLNLNDYVIKPCLGCFENIDFTSKSDQCYQDDDMNRIYPELNNSDIWVFTFPYTFCGGNRDLFNFLDRFEPLLHVDNVTLRNKSRGKVVVISTCSFWDEATYYPMIEQFKDFCALYGMDFAGALVRPDMSIMNQLASDNEEVNGILHAARQAGEYIIENDSIPEFIVNGIRQDLKERKQIYINN
jgi:multimeric flavodoxin WrbA